MFISKFVFDKKQIPLNTFMNFDYFLLDAVPRDIVRKSNNILIKKSDEVWIFGQTSNGVLAEIKLAKKYKKPIKYFNIIDSKKIIQISEKEAEMEK